MSRAIQTAPNNLYDYVPGEHSARGRFDDRSKRSSAEVFVVLHRQWFAWAALSLLAHGRFDARAAEPAMRIRHRRKA